MSKMTVHFSSATDDWATPQWLFDRLDKEFNFEWDVCASASNTKVPGCYFDKEQDGLSQHWAATARVFWMNPPYGRAIKHWDGTDARYEVLQISDKTGAVVWEGNDSKVSDSVLTRFGGQDFKWEYVGFIETGGCSVKVGWNTDTRFEEYRLEAK